MFLRRTQLYAVGIRYAYGLVAGHRTPNIISDKETQSVAVTNLGRSALVPVVCLFCLACKKHTRRFNPPSPL
jgi:hypothetical protein